MTAFQIANAEEQSLLRSLLRLVSTRALTYGAGEWLVKVGALLLIPIYTRYLSPAEYGVLAFVGTFSLLLGVLYRVGLNGALIKFNYDLTDDASRRRYYGTVYVFLTSFGLVLTILLNIVGPAIFDNVFKTIRFDPYLRLGSWVTFFSLAALVPLTIFQIQGKALQYRVVTTSQFVLSTGFVIVFVVFLGRGAEGSLSGQVLAGLTLATPLTLVTLRRVTMAVDWALLKKSLLFGFPLMVYNYAALTIEFSNRFFIERYSSLGDLGLYSLGYQFGWLMQSFLDAGHLAWTPIFFETAKRDDAPRAFGRFASYYFIVVTWAALTLALLAREAIRLVAPRTFHSSYDVVPVLVLSNSLSAVWYMLVNQVFVANKTGYLTLITLVSAAVNVMMNILVTSRLGILGAAWATCGSSLVQVVLLYQVSQRAYPVEFESARVLRIWVVGIGAFGCGYVLSPSGFWSAVMFKTGVVTVLYPVLLYAVGAVRRSEVKRVLDGVDMVKAKLGVRQVR
jgi:O-antigen/teichoic acid export membrane protein